MLFLIISLLTCGNVVFTVGTSVDVPVMQQELQEMLKSWKIYINKIDNIPSLLIEHIHHSLGRKPQQRMTDFQDTFYPISNSLHSCRAPAYMTKSRLIDWGNKNIPLQGEALHSNAKFPQLLNFVPHSLHPSETCQFACGGLAEKKTSPGGLGWHGPPLRGLRCFNQPRERQPDRGNHCPLLGVSAPWGLSACVPRPSIFLASCNPALVSCKRFLQPQGARHCWNSPKLVESSQSDFFYVQLSQCLGKLPIKPIKEQSQAKGCRLGAP